MMDLDRIKHNVGRMIDQGAPEQDIDAYLASEGTNAETLRSQRTAVPKTASEQLPSIYSQFPRDLENPMGLAATAGASDAQLADIVQKNLGGRFVRREPVDGGYEVFVTRGQDGQEQRGYLNQPGLDREDIVRGIRGALPYFGTGAAGVVAGAGRGLLANALIQGGAGGVTSVAGDVAQGPMGSEQGIEGGKAAIVGGLSAVAPVVGRMTGNAVSALRNWMAPQTGAIANASPRAVRRVEEAMQAGAIDRPHYQQFRAAFGDEGMLGDAGATLQTDTARLARMPVSSDVVSEALTNRAEGAAGRIRNDLDVFLGPERDLVEYTKQQGKAYNARAKPLYDIFQSARIKPTENLQGILDRAEAAGAAQKAATKLRIKGLDPNLPQNSGMYLDLIKREIDGMAGTAKSQGNRTDYSDLTKLASDLRNEVDNILSPGNPADSIWARARAIAGEGIEGREAADLGGTVFRSKRDPHQVAAELGDLSQYGREMYREGARNDLRQTMGRAGSNFGPKGDASARRALNNEFGRENLEQIAGAPAADNIIRRIVAENEMAELFDMAKRNSITSTMEASQARWPTPTEGRFASEAGKKGPVGLLTEALLRVGDAAVGGPLRKAELRAAVDGARILTAQGKERDALVDALFRHMEARRAGQISGEKYKDLVRTLLQAQAPIAQQPVQQLIAP